MRDLRKRFNMKREIKFSLVYRDMWQSSGKYVPTVSQLKEVAPAIIDMGCFDRVETNGGAFEQVNLLFGENPNKAVREWTAPFNKAGIQTHMLERGLNALRMNPVPADVRELMYKVKCKQGTNISRSFCGLNDHRNLRLSVEYAKKGGMISQVALSITNSPIHTVEYYMDIVDKVVGYGCDEICLKDMAGIGRPTMLGQLTKSIKTKYPHIKVQYHGHCGPGFSPASMLEVARAGADYLDVAVEPLSWGKVHPDVITIREMMKADGFLVKDLNMDAYMEVRRLTQKFIDEFLGYWIDPNNSHMSSLLVGCGLPGGMMGSMMADLKGFHGAINASLRNQGKDELSLDNLMVMLFQEVAYVWPRLGYPPLVTPFSQYVKNTALMNLMNILKGQPRWTTIDKDTWNMILGRMGKLPGELAPEIVEKANREGRKFFTGNPQDNYPDQLEKYRQMMWEKKWETGEDDEELFEYAMHPAQYEAYKSGKAKADFLEDVKKRREEKEVSHMAGDQTKVLTVDVNGQAYRVTVAFGDVHPDKLAGAAPAGGQTAAPAPAGEGKEVLSPLEGKFFLTKSAQETPVKVGDKVNQGDVICYVEAMKTYNAIRAEFSGTITAICVNSGDSVSEDDVLMKIL